MSDFHEIWKWDEAEQRLAFARRYCSQAGPDSGAMRLERLVADLREELEIMRRLLDAKNLECARLQKELEKRK